MQLGLNHYIFKTAEGEAFKMKEGGEEPAYLIYRTIKFLLIVFMHEVSKRSQTASDTFSFVNMPASVYQSSYSHEKRLKNENQEATRGKKKKVINNTHWRLLAISQAPYQA